MKLMTVAMGLIVALGATVVLAADTTTPTSQPGHRGERKGFGMMGGLNLTDKQKEQIKEIMTTAKADAEKATTPEAKRDIFKAAREKINKDVLTPEQAAKVKAMHGRHGMRGEGPFAKLNLTDDQKAKIKAIREDAQAKIKPIREDEHAKVLNVLTPEQRKQLEDMKSAASRPGHFGRGFGRGHRGGTPTSAPAATTN